MTHVHFWTRRPEALVPWNPDVEPERHANGYGHAFLELFCRMRADGRSVSLGPDVDRVSTVVVVSLEEIHEWQDQIPPRMEARLAMSLLRAARPPAVILLRVDRPLTVRPPMTTTVEVMPTRASISTDRQVWLPLLPQRGLIPRDPSRQSALHTVALKAYSYNVPEWVDADFRDEVERLDLHLRIDDEIGGRWADFSAVDVVLCTQRADSLGDERRKPPTKLINAWRAGAIPLCGDHVGYRELGEDAETMLVVDDQDPRSVLAALKRLIDDPDLVAHMRRSLPQDDYSAAAVMEQYWELFESAAPGHRMTAIRSLLRSLPTAVMIRLCRKRMRAG